MNELNIENTNIKTASGVSLDDTQKTLVGSVLDVSTPTALRDCYAKADKGSALRR